MIHTQSFFIAGIEDAEEARKSAFGAMAMFLVVLVFSLLGIWYDGVNKVEPLEDEEDEAEYQLSQDDVPTYGTST